MRNSSTMSAILFVFALSALSPVRAQELKPIELPKPQTTGGKPLMQALSERKSTRAFSAEKLSAQQLSNLLWAAFGINRPDGKRTAPSAMDKQEIDLYVTFEEGAYRYDAKANRLEPVVAKDLRALAGRQSFVASVPLNLVYVADYAKMIKETSAEDKVLFSGAATGFIGQNVYLFCASEGLATVIRAWVDREPLSKALGLRPDQKIILAQSVGYPKK